MKGPREQYTDDLKKKFGYYATWHPGTPLQLGDIGILSDNVFNRIGNVKKHGIDFEIRKDDTYEDLEYSTKGSVSITAKFAGTAAPQGSTLATVDAGMIIEFGNSNAIYFKAGKTKTNLIENVIQLGQEILRLFEEGKWNKKWVVITELVEAESATVLISNSSNAKIELKAKGNINAPTIDIADAEAEFTATFYKGMDTKIIAEKGLTPLLKVKGIKTRIFSKPHFELKGIHPSDLLTPENAKKEYKDQLIFDYINPKEQPGIMP